jgi:hypothetical protein
MFVKMSFWNGAKYANLVDLEPCCTMCFGGGIGFDTTENKPSNLCFYGLTPCTYTA